VCADRGSIGCTKGEPTHYSASTETMVRNLKLQHALQRTLLTPPRF